MTCETDVKKPYVKPELVSYSAEEILSSIGPAHAIYPVPDQTAP